VDAELERLRMTYIAGEITRERYYARRSELENLRRGLAAGSPSATGPKRLDLEMGQARSSEVPAPETPRRRSSLELPLPGEE
jgi:hypothetical protein